MSNEFPSPAWMEGFKQIVNADPELAVTGTWFNTAFSVAVGEVRYAMRVEKGRITEIIPSPRFDVRCAFGFRAPRAIWDKFISPNPPPLFHDFFAMLMRVPEFTLEGDGLIAMQNARALHRMMNLMRQTGQAHG